MAEEKDSLSTTAFDTASERSGNAVKIGETGEEPIEAGVEGASR